MAEDLTDYYRELGVRVRYLHSDIDTLERIDILRDLRRGEFDVLVGINLLREGLDLPEVSLVAILDADKEGFLRSPRSLIQTIGRAARNVNGQRHHVRRPDHRGDEARDRRDRPPPRDAGRVQQRARHHARDDHARGHGHQPGQRDDRLLRRAEELDAARTRRRARQRPTIASRRCARRCSPPPRTSSSRRRRGCATSCKLLERGGASTEPASSKKPGTKGPFPQAPARGARAAASNEMRPPSELSIALTTSRRGGSYAPTDVSVVFPVVFKILLGQLVERRDNATEVGGAWQERHKSLTHERLLECSVMPRGEVMLASTLP